MNANEILRADLLDILFEHRNKDYGAYDLRRKQNRHLWMATSIPFLVPVLLLLLMSLRRAGTDGDFNPASKSGPVVILTEYALPEPQQLPPVAIPPPANDRQYKERLSTSKIVIKPETSVSRPMSTQFELMDANPSDKKLEGSPASWIPVMKKPSLPLMHKAKAGISQDFIASHSEARFPGGAAALSRFFHENLVIPGELESGDSRTVRVQFSINAEGKVTDIQIIQSAGFSFDDEVIRVCRLMPRWTPAQQNGIDVEAIFKIPVTFIAPE
jgi:protein TonB